MNPDFEQIFSWISSIRNESSSKMFFTIFLEYHSLTDYLQFGSADLHFTDFISVHMLFITSFMFHLASRVSRRFGSPFCAGRFFVPVRLLSLYRVQIAPYVNIAITCWVKLCLLLILYLTVFNLRPLGWSMTFQCEVTSPSSAGCFTVIFPLLSGFTLLFGACFVSSYISDVCTPIPFSAF